MSERSAVLVAPDRATPADSSEAEPSLPGRSLLDSRRVALALLVLFAALFVVQAAPRITAPFGDSHDGENGAVWGLASRAIRVDGFIESRGGARLADGEGTYAHHPPLIATETAVGEAVLGENPASTRLPAWLASLATIPLLYLLLTALGLRRVPSAIGVIIALASPMFLVYGSMLDTLQIALPFAVAFLVVRARADVERRPVRPWISFALAVLLVMGSWEGALLCGIFVVIDTYWGWRDGRRMRPSQTTAGFLVGLVLVAAWFWWVAGSFAPVFEQARMRSGSGAAAIGWSTFLDFQGIYLGALIGPVVLVAGMVGLVLVLRGKSVRPTVLAIVAVVLAYPVLLRDGASNHDYWNYWLLVPLAIGAGCSVEHLWNWVAARYDSERLGLGIVATLGVVCVVLALTSGTPARRQFESGTSAARLLAAAQADHPGVHLAILDQVIGGDIRWADYSLTPRPTRLHNIEQIDRESIEHPDTPVLVKCVRRTAALDSLCATTDNADYVVVTAADLASSISR